MTYLLMYLEDTTEVQEQSKYTLLSIKIFYARTSSDLANHTFFPPKQIHDEATFSLRRAPPIASPSSNAFLTYLMGTIKLSIIGHCLVFRGLLQIE